MAQVPEANPCEFFHRLKQGTLIEGEGSVPLTSSLRQLVFQKSKQCSLSKVADLNQLVQGGQL